ncbi:MAG: protein kinase [Pseudomonadota bacterium]|nr:protein kinase [Pseudomonadota bacterium]
MESPPPDAGSLTERYSLGPVLGQGSYGVVYRAFDRMRGQNVALKKLHRTTPHALYRFKTEFRSVVHVQHPNLVRLHDLCAEGDDWFLTMELVEGVSFLEWVRAGVPNARADETLGEFTVDPSLPPALGELPAPKPGPASPPFDEARLRDAFRQLAEGVSALHATGTMHRDIKPTNVLVTREGRVVLLDFSLVTDLEADEQSRVFGGTPLYMAPEHVTHAPLTAAADWYSVGVILYEALTGLRPFTGARFEMLTQKTQARPTSPGEHIPNLPRDLVALCDALLEVDPTLRPTGADVLLKLGALPEAAPVSGAKVPFVGRTAQLAALGTAFERARGKAVVRIVDGPSGMGKSVLVRNFLRELTARDPAVVALTGRCFEREAVRFKGLDSLVDSLARFLRAQTAEVQEAVIPRHANALVRLFPVLGGVERLANRREGDVADSAEQRRRAFGALRELLARMGDRWPLVLFIDDVQWSDADTAALVAEVLRPPDAPSVLLVLACRRDDLSRSPLLSRLLEIARDEHDPLDIGFVHVDELTPAEALTLASALAPGEGAADRIVAEAKGNPYFVDQLARRAQAGGPVVSLDAVIRERVADLPEPARRLLLTVAVAGRPISRSLAWRAAGLDSESSAPDGEPSSPDGPAYHASILDVLVGAHLVRPGGTEDEVETWHDRVRESVVAGQDPATLRLRHLRLAKVLEAEPQPDAEALAAHLVAAGDDPRAATWGVRAGDAAVAALAFDRAVRHYSDALARGAPGYETRLRLARALAAAGRGAESARVQLAAAPLVADDEAQHLRAEASLNLLLQGHVNEGMAVLADALERTGFTMPKSPWRVLVSLLWRRAWLRVRGRNFTRRKVADIEPRLLARIDTLWSAAVGLAMFDQLRSADFHARGLMLALRAGDPLRMARAVSMELLHNAVGGSGTQARSFVLAGESQALVAEVDDPRVAAGSLLNRGISAFLNGQFVEARALIDRADEEFRTRCAGNTWERDNLNRFRARVLTLLGDLRTIIPLTRELVRDAEGRGDGYVSIHARLRTHHLVQMCEDTPQGVAEELDELLAAISGSGFHFQHVVHLLATAELDLFQGRPADAWNRVAATWPTIVRTMLLRVQVTRVEGAYLRGRCALAVVAVLPASDPRRAELLGIGEGEIRALHHESVPWASALAAILEASVARVGGRADAAALLGRAADRLDAVDMRLHAMSARLVAGEWAGQPDPAPRAWMREQGVRNPERLARMYVPGR